MSRNGKIAVAVVAGVLVLLVVCACACAGMAVLSRSSRWEYTSVRTESAESTVADAVSFAIPQGFVSGDSGEAFGIRWIELHPAGADGHIMLLSAPASLGLDLDAIRDVADDAADWSIRDAEGNAIATDTVNVVIRGQSIAMMHATGLNDDGQAFRSLTGMFEGRDGPVFLTIALPADQWDQDAIESFIASIQ
jgi:hypothetical protein